MTCLLTDFLYDAGGRVIAVTDPAGNITTYGYDAANQLTTLTNGENKTTQTTYYDNGLKHTVADPLSHTTTFTYDNDSRLTATEDANTNTVGVAYFNNNLVQANIDAKGKSTTYTYDYCNRLKTTEDANTNVTSINYDNAGRTVQTIDAMGKTTSYTYDNANRPRSVQDPNLNVTTTVYDDAGRVMNTLAYTGDGGSGSGGGHSLTTTFAYDNANRPTVVTDPLTHSVTTVYYPGGLVQAVVDPRTYRTTYTYDNANRRNSATDANLIVTSTVYYANGLVQATIDGNGHATSYTYDKANRPTSLINARSYITTWVYDDAGRKINEIDADNGTTTLGYDPVGNVTFTRDPRNQGATLTYDPNNRLTNRHYTDGTLHTFTYDNVGNRLTQASPVGTYTSTYTPRNQLETLTEPGGSKTVTYTYDDGMRRTAMQAYGEGAFTYTYDGVNRQTQVKNPQSDTTTLIYDDGGRLTQRQYANGVITTMTLDAAGNVTQIKHLAADSSTIAQLDYAYDNTNHKLTQTQTTGGDGSVTTWTYDGAYQLTNENSGGGETSSLAWTTLSVDQWASLTVDDWSTLPINPTAFNYTHTYDPAGNRTVWNDGTTVTTYTYDHANRLQTAAADSGDGAVTTTYTYDAAGNRTEEQTPDGYTYYTWDAPGHMVTADPSTGLVTFTYNADGQQVSKETSSATTGFLFDGQQLLQETDGVGGEVDNTYTTGSDQAFGDLYGEYGDNSQVHLYDAQGNTFALVDSSGDIQGPYAYTAFGEMEPAPDLDADLPSKMMYGGQKQYYSHPELDLNMLGMGADLGGRPARVGESQFMSQDPLGLAGGDDNVLIFIRNDPINRVDPSGHEDLTREQLDISFKLLYGEGGEKLLRAWTANRGDISIQSLWFSSSKRGFWDQHRIYLDKGLNPWKAATELYNWLREGLRISTVSADYHQTDATDLNLRGNGTMERLQQEQDARDQIARQGLKTANHLMDIYIRTMALTGTGSTWGLALYDLGNGDPSTAIFAAIPLVVPLLSKVGSEVPIKDATGKIIGRFIRKSSSKVVAEFVEGETKVVKEFDAELEETGQEGKAVAAENAGVQFGNDANQVSHAFRHVEAAGLDSAAVESAVRTDLQTAASKIVPGQPFNQTIQVGGQNITYTAFKLPNGVINVGRITVP